MRLAWRPPLFVLAVGLLGLLVLLATLQYVWLGRISEAERERLRATLASRTSEFAQDFDRELTRAYLLFQTEAPLPERHVQDAQTRLIERYDRWQATSAYPRLLQRFYVATRQPSGEFLLQQFDPATRRLVSADWPASMADWRTRLQDRTEQPSRPGESTLVVRRIAAPIWESVPALVVPTPMFVVTSLGGAPSLAPPEFSYTILTIDLDYVRSEMFPALAQKYFRRAGEPNEYHVAVVDSGGAGTIVYQSAAAFSARDATHGDAEAPLFQIRTQDFSALVAEVRRFAMFSTTTSPQLRIRKPAQMSILMQQATGPEPSVPGGLAPAARTPLPPRWHVVVRHPAGSLEAFVGSTRRRNLLVSSSILAVLGASMALLIVSTRRSQELARQQLEFVAAVSHELRTPLAVIRSAGDNLAHGVVHDQPQVRKYGELIRAEGRRLSDMVEQILEFSGIQSGQRRFARRPVPIAPVVEDIVSASRALLEEGGIRVEVDVPAGLPPVLGDDAAIGRLLQNLIGNAIKYGAGGRWIGIRAGASGGIVTISVSDKGIGIAPAEQARIFEPFYRAEDVIAARIQGAGLGLSLVQRIVEAHGGAIKVRSTPGAGSEFTVTLPAATGGTPEPVATAHPGAEAARSS